MIILKDKKSGAPQQFHSELIQGLLGEDLWMITLTGNMFRVKMLIQTNYFPEGKIVSFLNTRGIEPELYAD